MPKLTKNLILASNSPRRKQILTDAGFIFTVNVTDVDESFPLEMDPAEVTTYLAKKKALAIQNISDKEIVLAADTIVVIENEILNKPKDFKEAFEMLSKLSGKTHIVYTGICLRTINTIQTALDETEVTFKNLTASEITYYINTCQPFDKAGAYGVQDFIGMMGIPKINGSYFTVMGLPIHLVYEKLVDLGLVVFDN